MATLPIFKTSSFGVVNIKKIKLSQYKRFTYDEVKALTNNFGTCIGTGPSSKIYKGYLEGGAVAIKIYKNDDTRGDLDKEIEKLITIDHPSIVNIHGICKESNLCIIREYMEGGSLKNLINQRDMMVDKNKTLKILIFLANILKDLHRKNFFHLFIKPSNILFDESGNIKYSDFGSSYFLKDNVLPNEFDFQSWEQVYMDMVSINSGYFGSHTDVYYFGMLIVEMLIKRYDVFTLRKLREMLKNLNAECFVPYLRQEWQNENGLKMLACVLDCVHNDHEKRIIAQELVHKLEKIKYEIRYDHFIVNIYFKRIQSQNLLDDTSDQVPYFMIRPKERFCDPMDLTEKLCETYKEMSCNDTKARKRNQTLLLIPEFQFVLHNNDPINSMYKCYKIDGLNKILGVLLQTCKEVWFFNIRNLNIIEPIEVGNDVIIKSNVKIKLNFKKENFILIKSFNEIMIINAQIQHTEQENSKRSLIQIRNNGILSLLDVTFNDNSNILSLIYIGDVAQLNMDRCVFDNNKVYKKYVYNTIIYGATTSKITMYNCIIKYNEDYITCVQDSNHLIISNGYITISNCIFDNYVKNKFERVSLMFSDKADVLILNSTFRNCCNIIFLKKSTGLIKDCKFEKNGCKMQIGGVLFIKECAEIKIYNCNFNNNTSARGGSITCQNNSKIIISQSTFERNDAMSKKNGDGGAVLIMDNVHANVENCKFSHNRAIRWGGGLSVWGKAKMEINNCQFNRNLAVNRNGDSICYDSESNKIKMVGNTYLNSIEGNRSNIHILNN